MSELCEEVRPSEAIPLSLERRRAGRVAEVSPVLIPLLRGERPRPCDSDEVRAPDLAAATGIAVSVVLSAPVWITIGCIVHFG